LGAGHGLQAAELVGEFDGRGHAHFLKEVGAVELDGAGRDAQVVGNVFVVVALDEFVQHFALARAQGGQGQAQAAGLMAKLEPKGIKGLAFWDNGFKSFSANTPLKNVADYKGKKFRIQSSKVLEEEMRSVGGIPQVMAFSEVYQALQTGVVDGTENPISNFYTQKMHEVQKHLSLTNHGYLGYAVIVNKKFWDGLPADVRGQLEQAMKEATVYANKIAQEENELSLEGVRKSGKTTVYTPTNEERMALKKAMAPVHAKMAERVGKETLDTIYKETGYDPAKL
jgi:C4-dicarboxylate-binding protein DctP